MKANNSMIKTPQLCESFYSGKSLFSINLYFVMSSLIIDFKKFKAFLLNYFFLIFKESNTITYFYNLLTTIYIQCVDL